ncbi:AEC family transporter [Methylobacterium sp. J-043]|nr:AEC family transporter [Methylobacterium sp. J-043]
MQAVLNAALPLFGLILTGYLCGLFRVFSKAAADSLNAFVITLALPALVFVAMARMTPEQLGHLGFMMAYGGCVLVNSMLGFWLSRRRGESIADATMTGLNASYSNVGFMGLPLCLIVFGAEGLPPAVVATLFTACIHFLAAIVMIEADLKKGVSLGRRLGDVGFSLLRNPLFLAPIAGLGVGLSGLGLALPVARFGELLGAAAAPCALICIGLVLAQETLDVRELPRIGVLVALKLLLQPALAALLVFHVFAMPPVWASVAVILSALPTGPGAFSLAKAYGLQPAATSGVILVSHVVSVVTLSLVLAWLV